MSTISVLCSLDSPEQNQAMMRELPYYVADRWNRRVDRMLYTSDQECGYAMLADGQYPDFLQFCKFVAEEACVANGRCNMRCHTESKDYSKPATAGKYNEAKKLIGKERKMSLATQAKEEAEKF